MFLWIKAFHIIFIVCWFAGIFYLPRLFVYHAMSENQDTRDSLKIMERKLFRFVTPFAALTVLLGLAMTYLNASYYLHSGWYHAKMVLVLLLLAYHIHCGMIVKQFARDEIRHGHRFYRFFNEIPVLMLFSIVIFVVIKPF
jgi:putative membrane protein